MAPQWLKILNILAIPIALLIAGICWLCLSRETFLWGVYIIILFLLLVGYLNVRKPLIDYIEARKKAKSKPVDVKAEKRLAIINYLAFIAVLVIGVFSWFFLPRETFMWSAICMILILLLAGLANVGKVISDIS